MSTASSQSLKDVRAYRRRRTRWLRITAVACVLLLSALIAIRLWPHPPLSADQPQSTAVYDRDGRLLRLVLADDDRYRLWLPLKEISPRLRDAVLLHEDAWFYRHPGVNPVSVVRAAASTYAGGTRIGASTITMQLARLKWDLSTRTAGGKLLQILRALQLEAMYSKDEILEAYLNLAPYGGNIEGVGAASLIYFDKPASALTLPEALTLAVLPQAPTRRGRLRRDPEQGESYAGAGLSAARARLYARWKDEHATDAAQDASMALPITLRTPRGLPFAAPHFVEQVLGERVLHASHSAEAAGAHIETTLDLRLQRLLEGRVRQYVERVRGRGVRNAVAMLVDSRDMGVRALVGSADYFDAGIHGQVNGANGKRSPGSTLKPFIYALALDQGLLHPATVLRDVPTAFGPYTPENFDGRFVGPVTAAEALVRSRNIPAVAVATQLNQPSFYQFLRDSGLRDMASERHYGLALVLGGGEVTMEELARLYAMLSNDGLMRPLRWREQDAQVGGTALLSPEAAFIARDMLLRNPRPDLHFTSGLRHQPAAWKTGTSWGFRDAWSVGIVGPYVLAVWLGNFDGSGNPALVGLDMAAPLFFSIVDGLRASDIEPGAAPGQRLPEPPRRWPLNLKRVEVCKASGDLPNAWCPQRAWTWFIPGKSPIRTSTVHRAIAVDIATGRAACGPFDPARMRMQVFEFWPSDLMRAFAQAGMPRRAPPANADCADMADVGIGDAPRIQSPLRATRYVLRLSHPQESAIELRAAVDADVSRVFWFAGGSYVATTTRGGSAQWIPTREGAYRLSAVDDHGRADTREVQVVLAE
jgi:penicillin-binding protein 1C